MPITTLPPAPQRQDEPDLITQKADAMFSALPTFVTEANALETNVKAKEVSANAAAVDAQGNALEASNWAKLQNALVPIYNESTNSTSTVGSDYSAKEYAIGATVESAKRHASGTVATGSAKDWATKTNAEVVVGQGFGAKKYAIGAQEEAQAALASANAAANSEALALQHKLDAEAALDAFDDKYLGSKIQDPLVDNDGNPLQEGAFYVNSTTGFIRVYTNGAWVQGISAIAGVSSVNGSQGNLMLKTINGESVLGVGDISTVTSTGTETLTNKTIVDPILELSETNGLAGQVPVSQGAGLPPVWGEKQDKLVSGTNIKTINGATVLGSGDLEVGGGSLILVDEVNASASSTVELVGMNSTYKSYMIVASNLVMSASNNISFRIKQGSSYLITGYWGVRTSKDSGNPVDLNTKIENAANFLFTENNPAFNNFTMNIFDPAAASQSTQWIVFHTGWTSGSSYQTFSTGAQSAVGATTAIKFTPSGGTITSGNFKLYGLGG